MAQRRFHYEQAFEHYLRANRIPYIAVDEAKKALLPANDAMPAIKSFDFVVYGPDGRNLLLDVKGRKLAAARPNGGGRGRGGRLDNWVTREDVEGLTRWGELFGAGFEAMFLFMYWCERQPPDALYEEIFEFGGRWYALRETPLDAYRREMHTRSPRWGTLCVSSEAFDRISRPFSMRPPGESFRFRRREAGQPLSGESGTWKQSRGEDLRSGFAVRATLPGCRPARLAIS